MSESLKRRQAPAVAAPSPESFWFVVNEQTLKGPFTSGEILKLVSESKLEAGSYCWKQGYSEWRPLCSIEEFGLSAKPFVVKSYPKIAIPSAKPRKLRVNRRKNARAYSASHQPWRDNSEEQKRPVRVLLNKQNSWGVGNRERLFMAMFCVGVAWWASSAALDSVEEQFLLLMQKRNTGRWAQIDSQGLTQNQPWALSWLSPIMSAPGMQNELLKKAWPVRIQAQRQIQNPNDETRPWTYGSYQVNWTSPKPYSGFRFSGKTDPVYSQPMGMYVEWSANQPKILKGRTPGYPGL